MGHMRFYTVWVRSIGYRGKEPLTYSSDQELAAGAIVKVPLQRETVLGFIVQAVPKPPFTTKPLETITGLKNLPAQTIQSARWLLEYYGTNLGTVGTLLLPAAIDTKKVTQTNDNVVAKATKPLDISLNDDQQAVVSTITDATTYLLHGRTGSGKTRVYLALAKQTLADGRSVMVLTPEISLTSQLAANFQAVFGDQVLVLHSQLTPVQRQLVWLRILQSSQPLIIIGPRSILFSPVRDLGLVIIDEAHEPAYKQEQAPYYHARTVASELTRLHQAKLVLGSATPSLGDYYLAQVRQRPILRLESLAQSINTAETKVDIVDLKDRSQFSRSSRLSKPLLDAVKIALNSQQQSLIYLNRRGTARIVLCDNCGWQALCPHCDLPVVYHGDSSQFRCHTCGYHQSIVTSCPICGQPEVVFKSFGTKALYEELTKLFPDARIQRFDTDNSKAERFEQQYAAIQAGAVDILVGTQLLAKGLDLPNLAVLGIVLADSSLSIPDFSARERTFQLITQALGRVGRGHVAGQAIIQTYHPDSTLLQAAIHDDWDTFYNTELAERQKFHFPPFYHLLKLSCRRATYKSAETAANKLKDDVLKTITSIEIDGPAPSFHEKLQGKYQCQLVFRSRQRAKLLEVISQIPSNGWSYDIDPVNLL